MGQTPVFRIMQALCGRKCGKYLNKSVMLSKYFSHTTVLRSKVPYKSGRVLQLCQIKSRNGKYLQKNPEIFCHRLIWSLPINWCSWNILCFSFRNKSTQGKPQYIENLFQDIQYSCIKVADKAICIVNYSEIKSHTDLAPEDCIKIQENAFKLISDPCIWSRTHNLPLDAFERSASSIISFLRILWKP